MHLHPGASQSMRSQFFSLFRLNPVFAMALSSVLAFVYFHHIFLLFDSFVGFLFFLFYVSCWIMSDAGPILEFFPLNTCSRNSLPVVDLKNFT